MNAVIEKLNTNLLNREKAIVADRVTSNPHVGIGELSVGIVVNSVPNYDKETINHLHEIAERLIQPRQLNEEFLCTLQNSWAIVQSFEDFGKAKHQAIHVVKELEVLVLPFYARSAQTRVNWVEQDLEIQHNFFPNFEEIVDQFELGCKLSDEGHNKDAIWNFKQVFKKIGDVWFANNLFNYYNK